MNPLEGQKAPFDAVEEHLKGIQTIVEIAEQVCAPEPILTGELQTEIKAILEEPAEFTPMADEKLQAALKTIRQRSFSARNPHLGKMIKCQVCGLRHRAAPARADEKSPIVYVTACQQKFTNVKNGHEYFREDPKTGTLVPDLRTAVDPELEPTVRQIVGVAAFAKRRKKPHHNAKQLQLVERTRKVFAEMGFTITESENPEIQKQAQKNMEIARKAARRQLRKESRERARKIRNRQKESHRINRG